MPEHLPDLTDLGRFAEPSLLILASLAGGPKHGYAMMEDIEAMSGVRLGPGTLYGALARLERHPRCRLSGMCREGRKECGPAAIWRRWHGRRAPARTCERCGRAA